MYRMKLVKIPPFTHLHKHVVGTSRWWDLLLDAMAVEHGEHLLYIRQARRAPGHLDEHLLHTWTSMEVKPSDTDALTVFRWGGAGVHRAHGPWRRLQGTQHAHRARLGLPLGVVHSCCSPLPPWLMSSSSSSAASSSPSSSPSTGSAQSMASISEKEHDSTTLACGPRLATTRSRRQRGGARTPRELIVEHRGSLLR